MKHIKDILGQRQLSLFAGSSTKGSREWSAFNSIVDDRVDTYPTRTARTRETGYGSVIRVRRVQNPHSLFPKRA